MIVEYKICNQCLVKKILNDFYFRKDNKKYRNKCKDCIKQSKLQRYIDSPELRKIHKQKQKLYYQKYPERLKYTNHKKYIKHRGQILLQKKGLLAVK